LQGIKATIDFTNSLKRLVSSGDAKSLAEADRRLRYNLRYWNVNRSLARPNDYSFGVVLGAYSKARRIPGIAVRAEELLELMMDTYEMQEKRDGNNVWLIPSAFCTSAAISAWSKNTNILFDKEMSPIARASAIVDRLEQLHERYGRPQTQPNAAVYNALISICAFVNNGRGAGRQLSIDQRFENAKYAESILDMMEAKYIAGDSSSRPNVRTYGSLIQTWAGASSISNPRAAERVEVILQHMEDMYKRTRDIEIRPNFFCYTNAIHCWGRSERPDAVEKAMEIVERMERLSDSRENTEARPNAFAYCAVINALAKSRSSGHAGGRLTGKEVRDKTDALLRRMKERGVAADRATMNAALNAFARSGGDPRTVARAEEIVSDMEKSTFARGTPDIATWNTLINVYTKSGDPAAPEKAERVLRKVESSYLNGTYDRRPQALTYSAVIQAWAKSCRPEAAKRARGIIDAMRKPKTGVGGRSLVTEPTSVCYDGLIHALARSDDEDAVQQIEETLRYMEDQASVGNTSIVPTTRTYQAAILGLSKRSNTNDGAAKAEKILRRMIELHKGGSHDVQPNRFAYSACIQAFASLKSKEGAAKAYELLREMLLAYNKSGDRAIRPNEVTWSIVIHAFANSNEPGTANNLLRKMIELSALEEYAEVTPNHVVFTSVISAHAQAGEGRQAEELLREMYDSYAEGKESLKPSVAAFTACIQAYANASDAVTAVSRAEALFNEMWTRTSDGEVGVKPNGGTYSAMLDLYCKIGGNENLSKAESLLERMVDECASGDESVRPGQRAFSSVLDAYVASGNDKGIERVGLLKQRVQDV